MGCADEAEDAEASGLNSVVDSPETEVLVSGEEKVELSFTSVGGPGGFRPETVVHATNEQLTDT